MKNFAKTFLKQIQETISQIQCTDFKKKRLKTEDAISKSFSLIKKAKKNSRKVILVGNGGSSSIASHIAIDLWKNGGVKATAFNDASLLTCLSNDLGYEHVFEAPIKMFGKKGDVLIAISSSGKSVNILKACEAAKLKGCCVITMSGFSPDNPLRQKGDYNFFVPSPGYGHVETAHAALCHALVDSVIKDKKLN